MKYREDKKASVAPMLEAKDTSTTPQPNPNKVPAARVIHNTFQIE